MANDFLEILETIDFNEASPQRLFAGEGKGVRSIQEAKANDMKYQQKLLTAVNFVKDIYTGKRPPTHFSEAMSTDDFKILFSDILDRQLLANYRDAPMSWNQYIRRSLVPDFRNVKRFFIDGANTVLEPVKELSEYPETNLSEGEFSYKVSKFGRRLPLSWETVINDDIGALRDIPLRFGQAARATEEMTATQIFADATGPKASVFKAEHKNVVDGNPPLSLLALQKAFTQMTRQRDASNRPIIVENIILVVPPALEFVANNIISNGTVTIGADADSLKQVVPNWLQNKVRVVVNWYLPTVVTNGTVGETNWYLFGDPNVGRPAAEMGFLIGHEEPEIFMKASNAIRVGSGAMTASIEGDFDTDAVQYKVRHIMGGAPIDPKMMMASTGAGAPVTTYP